MSKTIAYINKGVELNQPRLLQRAIRQNATIRHKATKELLLLILSRHVPVMCASFEAMHSAVQLLPSVAVAMDVDGSSVQAIDLSAVPPTTIFPETEVYVFTIIVTTLLREKLDAQAAAVSSALVERIKTFNRRSLDLVASKAFFYYSLAFERINKLDHIRPSLLGLYRTACIRHDDMSQAVLLNLILRNYLHYNLISQAQIFSMRTTFPESASNNQFCRFLYYMGRILAVQLEYSQAYQRLVMAKRKAPHGTAQGFSVLVSKLTVIVMLLMGDIPEKSLFNQTDLRSALRPYLSLTQAVRNGDLQQFQQVVAQHEATFKSDKNMALVQRLGHNVLKTGLRKISVAYSRISLEDVAAKLHLGSTASTEYICAKAIRYECMYCIY